MPRKETPFDDAGLRQAHSQVAYKYQQQAGGSQTPQFQARTLRRAAVGLHSFSRGAPNELDVLLPGVRKRGRWILRK
jgi:hypothetical protein